MEAPPKVHRHRHRRTSSRRHNNDDNNSIERNRTDHQHHNNHQHHHNNQQQQQQQQRQQQHLRLHHQGAIISGEQQQQQQQQQQQSTNQQLLYENPCVLVNGHELPPDDDKDEEIEKEGKNDDRNSKYPSNQEMEKDTLSKPSTDFVDLNSSTNTSGTTTIDPNDVVAGANRSNVDSYGDSIGGGGGGGDCGGGGGGGGVDDSLINSGYGNIGRHNNEDRHLQKGIIGFMDRELKTTAAIGPNNTITTTTTTTTVSVAAAVGSITAGKKTQSLSDPQASPAQRSTRSRSSLEKSPRRKRSKSESRRRRERKLIAAGEMEVRQANETLMRYLKQCSEMNDASLSGELEIDHNFDERRVHRKTKSQRDRRGYLLSKTHGGRMYATGGLSSILKDLSDDILPSNGEIYNPFTPVVSPTEGPPTRIDKMFIQTSSGYRAVDHCFYKNPIGNDPESNENDIVTSVNLSCALQRIWIMVSNICHGLLGGLALAHLLFILTSRPYDWADGAIRHYSSFAEIYANTFYCLSIICMVSIFDRMDICHIDITNAPELISFRWIIIAMIYIATIILTLCAESMDEKLYLTNTNITMFEEEMINNQVLNIWNSLSIARSIGAIVGWILISFSPTEDLLYEHLLEMEKYQLTNN